MFAHRPRRGPHPRTAARQAAARLRRLAAALAALTCALLASAAVVPAASAAIIPIPRDGPYGPAPAAAVRVITAGGMAGWQITLIALGAALAGLRRDQAPDPARPATCHPRSQRSGSGGWIRPGRLAASRPETRATHDGHWPICAAAEGDRAPAPPACCRGLPCSAPQGLRS